MLDQILKYLPEGLVSLRFVVTASMGIGLYLSLRILRSVVQRRAKRADSHASKFLIRETLVTLADKLSLALLALFSIGVTFSFLDLSARVETLLHSAIALVVLFQGGLWVSALFAIFLNYQFQAVEDPSHKSAFGLLSFAGKVIIWTVILLVILDNFGFDVSALIAGLGVGGIAIALAVQNILGDLFASLSIILDRPFEVGDYVVVGELQGTVERIGIKSTRVRSLSGEQIIVANSDLLSSRIRNYKRLYERRIVFSVGVIYSTPLEKIRSIPTWIKAIVEVQQEARFDRAHFKEFGGSALSFEVVYYVLRSDYRSYMDVQQSINLALFEKFADEKIEFAFPSQTLYVASLPKGGVSAG